MVIIFFLLLFIKARNYKNIHWSFFWQMKKFSNDASMSNCSKWKECDKLEDYLQYTPKIQVFVRRKSVLIGHYRIAVDMKHENINFGYNKLKSQILKWYYLSMSSDSGRAEMEGYGKLNSNGTSLNSPHAGFLPLHPARFTLNSSWGTGHFLW